MLPSSRLRLLPTALLLVGCSTQKLENVQKAKPSDLQITQFYTSTPSVPKGATALLCYGVEGAASVSLEPPVEQLSPSRTRCFEVKPTETTNYVLSARGRDGETAEKKTTITVGGSAPKLLDTFVNKNSVKSGEEITVCWTAKDASTVEAGPGKYLRGGNPGKDCVVDHPTQTTTYKVTVSNTQGLQDTAAVTVRVK